MQIIKIDTTKQPIPPVSPLPFGGTNPRGDALGTNSRYFTHNGEPWLPTMGEIHYSRCPVQYWEEALLKIKAGGICIVASYVFWIHHEESEGTLDWEGNRNLHYFVELCAKHGLYFWLRIGPWAHGECRNGGFPDWLLQKDFEPRTNDARYFTRVRAFYAAIFAQVQGLLFKDGGPVIGIQIENEYGHCGGLHGEEGIRHMRTLKQIAVETGFVVPFYSATGWGGAAVVEDEMLPVFGAYADRPWTQHTRPLEPVKNYLFSSCRDDMTIGSDLSGEHIFEVTYDAEKYPFATAELGGGNQVTYKRRPVLAAADIEAMSLVKLGSGANLLGYYMYHGGINPVGKLSTLQEASIYNDYPVFTYDFQAPLREYGQVSETYRSLKRLMLFACTFGTVLAPCTTLIPEANPQDAGDTEKMRYAVREHQGSGFLFWNNYQRNIAMPAKTNVRFIVETCRGTVPFPVMTLPANSYGILPFNLPMSDIVLQAATTQLLTKTDYEDTEYWFFFGLPGGEPVYRFVADNIAALDCPHGEVIPSGECTEVRLQRCSRDSRIRIRSRAGKRLVIITLSAAESLQFWKLDYLGRERIFLSVQDLSCDGKTLTMHGWQPGSWDLVVFPAPESPLLRKEDIFARYAYNVAAQAVSVTVREAGQAEDGSCSWKINLSGAARLTDEARLFLRIEYAGDTIKLMAGAALLVDNYYMGTVWDVGLEYFFEKAAIPELTLVITPLAVEQDVYLERRPQFAEGRALRLVSVQAVLQYGKQINLG